MVGLEDKSPTRYETEDRVDPPKYRGLAWSSLKNVHSLIWTLPESSAYWTTERETVGLSRKGG